MATMTNYEPWNALQKFHDDVNRLFNGRYAVVDEGDGSRVVTSHWSPAVDIKEEQNRFVLFADVPGMDPKDIEITMADGVLTIKGERRWEEAEERNGFKRVERARGTFYRRFSLPDTADAEHISARGANGVLEVTIPKQERAQPRRIPVG
jgi:HSP20 family protein